MLTVPLTLLVVAAAPQQARCEKVFDRLLPQLQEEWARGVPKLAEKFGKHVDQLKVLFVKECKTLSSADLDCGEGKGNPDDEASCKTLPANLRDECLTASRADRDNPMACKQISRALNQAGRVWSASLMSDADVKKATEETVGMWPKEGVQSFLKSCAADAPTDLPVDPATYCQCLSGQLQARLSWREFSQLTQDAKRGKPASPATLRMLSEAASLCQQ